jgi:hypothetical protein
MWKMHLTRAIPHSHLSKVLMLGRSSSPRWKRSLEVELTESGFSLESRCDGHQENGFVTSQRFDDWLATRFILEVIGQQ